MKTFNKLCIGDTIHVIFRNLTLLDKEDQYRNITKANLVSTPILIKNLYLNDSGNLLINWNGNNDQYYSRADCSISPDGLNKNIHKDKEGNIYFSNILFFERIAKSLVLQAIKKAEKEIESAIYIQNKRIKDLRVHYYELLNPFACNIGESHL